MLDASMNLLRARFVCVQAVAVRSNDPTKVILHSTSRFEVKSSVYI